MISRSTIAAVLSASLLIAGCSTVNKTTLSAESKKKIKTVAVVAATEPEKYFLDPGQLPGGAGLYVFGALGGLILGGIEVSRVESASNEFTAAIRPSNPDVARHWNEGVTALLQSKGYEVVQLAQLPKKADGKEIDCSSVSGKYDALLLSTISTGYAVEVAVEPRVLATVRLASGDCVDTLYSDGILYSSKPLGKFTHIGRDPKFSFPSREALLADPKKATDALRTGLSEIAKRATSDL